MTQEEAYTWAAQRCAHQEQCPTDIAQKLRQRQTSNKDIETVINRLCDEGFINTTRYATAYTHDKIRFNHWGRRKVSFMLRGKDIPSSDIKAALRTIDKEEYRNILRTVLSSKLRTLHTDNHYIRKQKLIAFALGRGFEFDLIDTLIDDLE